MITSNDYRTHMIATAKRSVNSSYTGAIHPSSSDIKHWKYIKREKVNGKWRYYYAEDTLKNAIKDRLGYDERDRMRQAYAERERLDDQYDKMQDHKLQWMEKAKVGFGEEGREEYVKGLIDWGNELTEQQNKVIAAGKKYTEAKSDFKKTPLGALTTLKETVETGMWEVENFLKKLTSKKKK